MNSLEQQVSALDLKVEVLHKAIDQLAQRINELAPDVQACFKGEWSGTDGTASYPSDYQKNGSSLSSSRTQESLEHKDVLRDRPYPDPDQSNSERILSPELQVQRLTAQLTAAYNRIASLEEQLLARRVHS